jgi:hypothetical protein
MRLIALLLVVVTKLLLLSLILVIAGRGFLWIVEEPNLFTIWAKVMLTLAFGILFLPIAVLLQEKKHRRPPR